MNFAVQLLKMDAVLRITSRVSLCQKISIQIEI